MTRTIATLALLAALGGALTACGELHPGDMSGVAPVAAPRGNSAALTPSSAVG